MKHTSYLCILLALFLSQAGCDLSTICDGTLTATYEVGADVEADFDENNVTFNAEILTSTCSSLAAGETATDSIDNLNRTGNTLTISHDGVDVTAEIDGENVSQFAREQDVSGCNINITMTGEFDTIGDNLVTTGEFTAEGVTCNPKL